MSVLGASCIISLTFGDICAMLCNKFMKGAVAMISHPNLHVARSGGP